MKHLKKFNENFKVNENLRKATDHELEVFQFLDELRDSGTVNMFGASSYVQDEFDVSKKEAMELVSLWMNNYNENGDYSEIVVD